jgi:hypothetical protein
LNYSKWRDGKDWPVILISSIEVINLTWDINCFLFMLVCELLMVLCHQLRFIYPIEYPPFEKRHFSLHRARVSSRYGINKKWRNKNRPVARTRTKDLHTKDVPTSAKSVTQNNINSS